MVSHAAGTPTALDRLDRRISASMRRWGTPAMRLALAVIFVWFGILKPLGLSPAADLVRASVTWLPFFSPDDWVAIIGWWEVAIGLTFLGRRTARVAIALLAVQMVGAFLPLFLLPEVTFQPGRAPWALTLEGQYIVKNVLIVAAAMALGGRVRRLDGDAVEPEPGRR
jgi:uncharacterized membrane protein YkgB